MLVEALQEETPRDQARALDRETLDRAIAKLLIHPDLDSLLQGNAGYFPKFMAKLSETLERAFKHASTASLFEAHKALYSLYEESIDTPRPGAGANQFHPFVIRVRSEIERAWEKFELARIDLSPSEIPDDPQAFIGYFTERCFSHRLAKHPLFDFLEKDASRDMLVSFFRHEGTLILRFCDLIVLSMIGVDEKVRGELAENFWDEMGNGSYQDRHTEMFRRLLRHAGVDPSDGLLNSRDFADNLGWQGLAGYNFYLFLLFHRRNHFRSMGGMGIAEKMDPPQYEKIVRGCRRVGLYEKKAMAYYDDHVAVDAIHGDGWLNNVMLPLARQHPEAAFDMMIGAEMRLNTTADYYDFLLAKLKGDGAGPRRRGHEQLTCGPARQAATVEPCSVAG